MKKLSTRKRYLQLVSKKRRLTLKGKEFHYSSKRTSPKFRKIMENNTLILRKLSHYKKIKL